MKDEISKEQRKVLDELSVVTLYRYMKRRREKLRKKCGLYAGPKHLFHFCPGCKGGPFGVRELMRHKRACDMYQRRAR